MNSYAMVTADAGETYMYSMLAIWVFLMPFVMIGLGALSGGGRSVRTRVLGVVVSLLVTTWFVVSWVVSTWHGLDDAYFRSDVVGGSLCGLTWLLVPWLVTLLITGWRRRRARRPARVPDDEIMTVPDDGPAVPDDTTGVPDDGPAVPDDATGVPGEPGEPDDGPEAPDHGPSDPAHRPNEPGRELL
ncbi:hypothetical protein ACTOB_004704 [Actinoplanes oblitus]|uniref:Uncharacterized protein n=1 Tax=Actinoplanes oblitus TaxID=3040509 RepID=A0ABY8W4F9_9ACTN|nr:hypothetical protein [Actinoplanes oblitus]WIM92749.1 hypothetical protein ACTOB_004704 [Actinoplanes oblitus]